MSQEVQRVQELLPLRHSRMSLNPFAFLRGAAGVMASDLGSEPSTGLTVQHCVKVSGRRTANGYIALMGKVDTSPVALTWT